MRLLLINPFYPISETPSPPLGLAFLGAALERAGVEVKILDLVVSPYSKNMLESVLKGFLPHIVGTTAVTMTFDNAINVIEDVKSIDPDVITVMGGPHVTFCAGDTMNSFPALDCIVLGEGEETIVDLARAVEGGHNWGDIRGLVYRNGSGIHSTGFKPPGIELDSLPVPARHLLPLGRYRALEMPVSMTTSRGCPFKCIFCVGRKMVGAKIRYLSPEKVVDELEYLSTLNFHQINIADDVFTASKRHCLAVCNEIMRRKIKTRWSAFARVDTVSREVLAKMKGAGCAVLSFGVETANRDILKTIKKGITPEQVIAAVQMCKDLEITPHASFILGLPGETPETLKETVDFGEKLKDMGVSHGFHLLAPFPGTEIREESTRFDIRILTSDWREYHANRAIVETPSVNRKMLDEIVIEWESEFDEWLGEIKRLMERGEAAEDEIRQLVDLERTVLIYDLMMGRVVEEKGSWRKENKVVSDSDALKALVSRVVRSTKNGDEQVFNTLNYAVEQGNLRYVEDSGLIRWEWVEFL
jgi:anaerobic magnesium-protoporphyrin IX monomethyl ester cyclase